MENTNNSVMVIGLGELGGKVLEILARVPNISKIIAADVEEDYGQRKTNTAFMGASYMDLYPDIEFTKIDLSNVEKTADLISEVNPHVIYNATTLQSWWVIDNLPPDVHSELYKKYCGLGPWLALHLLLVKKLMHAVEDVGSNSVVVSSSFPDNVNYVLGKIGLSPDVGTGNVDLIIPAWRKVVSESLDVPFRAVKVYSVGHHYNSYNLGRTGTGLDAPFYIKIMVEDKDVTDQFDIKELAQKIPDKAKRASGSQINWIVASSAVKIILGILNDTNEISHAPGPNGLPGGYPVRLNKSGVEVYLPEGLSKEEAIKVNKEAQKWDGIERVEDDGTVVFTETAHNTFKDLLGYDCKKMRLDEIESRAEELDNCYKAFAKKHGVDV